MTAKLIPVVEAFRAIIRTTNPEREDLQQIDSYRWFHDRQRIVVGDPIEGDNLFDHLFCRGTLVAAPADQPAYDALELLRSGVKNQKIRLRGSLSGAVPADIDPIEASEGDLDVFAGALVVTINDIFRSKRTYTSLYCYTEDLPQPQPNLGPRPRRGAPAKYDWQAIRLFTFDQLSTRGDFAEDDQMDGWKTYADLYRAIEEQFGEKCPELTTLKERVPAFVDEWREQKVAN